MNRPDLFALVGHRVTITRPGHTDPVTGRLAAYAESPHLIFDLDDGQRWILSQDRCNVTPADDTPPEPAYLAHPIPAILTFPGQPDLHVTARLGIDTTRMQWWADLNFHPLKPPAADTECTLRLPGGEPGRGRIAAGSTIMLGEGLAPTIGAAPDYGQTVDSEIPAWRPWFDNPGETGLLAALRDMTANLKQHIDQRAAELAQPHIEEANERVAAAEERCRELRDASWSARREHDRRTEVLRQRAEASEDAIVKTHDHLTRNLTGLVGKSGYEAGYRDCANEITRILNHQQEADRG